VNSTVSRALIGLTLFTPLALANANITPTPQSITKSSPIQLTNSFQIQNSFPDFDPTVKAFITDWNITSAKSARPLIITCNPKLAEEQYTIKLGPQTEVAASTPTGLAWALQSLGQTLNTKTSTQFINDQPDVPFRSVSIDVARRFHSIATLKNLVRYCQVGKVRYIQLHLTDDQNWMFPTEVFKGVDKDNNHKRPAYTSAELTDLQYFASARGVTIIPEIDIPGHSSHLTNLDPALMRIQGSESTNCIDFASPIVRSKLKSLLKEVATIFPNSPYIHIGGDEAWYPDAERDQDFADAIKRLGKDANPGTVFIDFVAEMAEEVIKLHKTPLVWEGFPASEFAKQHIPKQTVVIAWEGWYYPAKQLLPDGYKVVNGGWDPYYVVNHFPYELFTLAPLERLYSSDPNRFGIVAWSDGHEPSFQFAKSDQLIGSLMCWWEGHEWNAQKVLAPRIVTFGTSLWNRKGETNYPSFLKRLNDRTSQIETQAFPFRTKSAGITNQTSGEFINKVTLNLTPNNPNLHLAVRFDGEVPTTSDLIENPDIEVDDSKVVSIQAYENNKPVGETKFIPLNKVKIIKSLSYKCAVTSTSESDPQFPASAVTDGISDHLSSYWLGYPAPQSITIDLKSPLDFNRIQVVAFWATGAPTHYKLSVSTDNINWHQIVDASKQTRPTTQAGYTHTIPTTNARYLRLDAGFTPLFPSTMVRINEIRVYND
jgi:hexosaminidase